MPTTAEFRHQVPRSAWMAARARNAMRRPVFVIALTAGAAITALVAVVTTQQAQRAERALPPPAARPDTLPFAITFATASVRLSDAESSLVNARTRATQVSPAAVDTMSPARRARRDSLDIAILDLERLIARAENAPLSASYRGLAESAALKGDPRMRALGDSLTEIEKEREAFGAIGGVDPVFVALTGRATEVGRAMQAIALERRAGLQRDVASLAPAVVHPVDLASIDTASRLLSLDSARAGAADANRQLSRMRDSVNAIAKREAEVRDIATAATPVMAILGASILFGAVIGFGTALVAELRRPRIADAGEAERLTMVRVVAKVRPRQRPKDRQRRESDRLAPPYLEPRTDGYQLAYLHVVPPGTGLLMVTLVGPDMPIVGVIAANLAAVAADEARNALLIDADPASSTVSGTLRIPNDPGVLDAAAGRVEWAEVTQGTPTGRDRAIEVVTSGTGRSERDPATVADAVVRETARLSRHYDAIFVVASPQQVNAGLAAALPVHSVVLCARIGYTRLRDLQRLVAQVREAGGNPVGIVLWDGLVPEVPPVSGPRRSANSAEPASVNG
ncbi:MAG: hypothetical protein JWO05_1788 [Gemmatimonadetes bacterium]|nr:hypothetical protein [Gemmatimonadota bacterium]